MAESLAELSPTQLDTSGNLNLEVMGLHRELRRCPTEVFKVSAWFLLAALCRGKRLKEDLVSRKDGLGHSQPTQIVEYAKIRRVTVWKATLERKSEKWLDDLLVPGKDQNVPGI